VLIWRGLLLLLLALLLLALLLRRTSALLLLLLLLLLLEVCVLGAHRLEDLLLLLHAHCIVLLQQLHGLCCAGSGGPLGHVSGLRTKGYLLKLLQLLLSLEGCLGGG
jgi:hypothetical protein